MSFFRAWKSSKHTGKSSKGISQDIISHKRDINDELSANTKASFLSLPGELRNQIYAFIIYPHQERIFCAYHTSPQDISRSLLRPHIYRINHQIRTEALTFLCANKLFTILNFQAANTFLRYISPAGRASLTNFTVLFSSFYAPSHQVDEFISLLRETRRLKMLHLQFAHQAARWDDFLVTQWEMLASIKRLEEDIEELNFTWGIKGVQLLDFERLPREVENVLGKENWVADEPPNGW